MGWYYESEESKMQTLFNEIGLFGKRMGGTRSVLLHLVLLAAFGIWLPHNKGLDFLDSQVLGAYACLGLIFAGPATAQAFTETFTPTFPVAKARILVGVLYGEAAVLALTGAGIATVFLSLRGRYVPSLDWQTLVKSASLGLGAAGLVASMAAWLTVRFSKNIAMICLRLVFFGLLVLFFYRGQRLPDVALEGAGICLAAAAVFIVLLRRVCHLSPYHTT
jgi:hypothetical protein